MVARPSASVRPLLVLALGFPLWKGEKEGKRPVVGGAPCEKRRGGVDFVRGLIPRFILRCRFIGSFQSTRKICVLRDLS